MSGTIRARAGKSFLPPALAILLAASGAVAGCVTGSDEARPSEAAIESATTATSGTAADGNPAAGEEIFAQRCAKCHSLDHGRSERRVNLGDLQPSFDVVVDAVERGGIVMPSFRRTLSDEEIRDVAAYVTESVRP
jgi:mono/diheme cytochrome c family protein